MTTLNAAGDENAYWYSTEEIAAKIADRVPHADLDGFPLNERLRIGKAVAPLFQELLPAAPAGDGGLREALEKHRFCSHHRRVQGCPYCDCDEEVKRILAAHPAAPAVPLPDNGDAFARGAAAEHAAGHLGIPLEGCAECRTARPAVPLPVDRPVLDREAARKAIYTSLFGKAEGTYDNIEIAIDAVMELARPMPTREQLAICLHSFDGFAIETAEQWSDCNPERQGAFLYQAAAVLALLNGSES